MMQLITGQLIKIDNGLLFKVQNLVFVYVNTKTTDNKIILKTLVGATGFEPVTSSL